MPASSGSSYAIANGNGETLKLLHIEDHQKPPLTTTHNDEFNDESSSSRSRSPSPSSSAAATAAPLTFLTFLHSELLNVDGSGSPPNHSAAPFQLLYNFLVLPLYLEQLLLLGFAISADCFLYLFTTLPLRLVLTVVTATPMTARHYRDMMRLALLIAGWYALSHIHMSLVYHHIRGQSVLKLYVIFNMLQICDRLLSSFGEDIIDSFLLSQSIIARFFHSAIALAYLILHSALLFTQVIALNVAVNSDNSALFVLLVSNNFVELKGAVFKKFDQTNLLQISCSDIVERFQLIIFLVVITIQNITHLGLVSGGVQWLSHALYMCAMVIIGEMIVDWVKHGFICKFNLISPRVYRQFIAVIYHDFRQTHMSRHDHHIHSVSRRLGLSSFPLAVLLLRVLTQAFTSSRTHIEYGTSEFTLRAIILITLFATLCVLKTLLTVTLLGHAETNYAETDTIKRRKTSRTVKRLSGVDSQSKSANHSETLQKECIDPAPNIDSATPIVSTVGSAATSPRIVFPFAPSILLSPAVSLVPSPVASNNHTETQPSPATSPSISPSHSRTNSDPPRSPLLVVSNVVIAHDRVGSVDLIVPTPLSYEKLLAVDRYQRV